MELLFRAKRADEVEQEVTQRDQFNTDEVSLIATVVREANQNSLDAASQNSPPPVRVRISFVAPNRDQRDYFRALFANLAPHLEASEIDLEGLDLGMPSWLVIEDFGTTGLLGRYDDPDDTAPFNDFWRRVGKSHKTGSSNGRWGLGKLVFSSASQIRTFFGLTVRDDDPSRCPLLMGQVVLATHKIGATKYAPHGFFARKGLAGLQLPETDREIIRRFRVASGITRTNEPGLSIAIPFALEDITPAALIPEILKNYFFPILTGQLEVEIQGMSINASTFDAVAAQYAKGMNSSDGDLIAFIRKIHAAKQQEPRIVVAPTWPESMEHAIDERQIEQARKAFSTDEELVHARLPVSLKRKSGEVEESSFDLFLQRTPGGKRGEALYVRSAITVPDEARYFRARQTFGALVASDAAITSFLGDAENPAHTKWNGAAEKLAKNWKSGRTRLSEIRNSLDRLYQALSQAIELKEPEALIDVFSIREPVRLGRSKKTKKPKPEVLPTVQRSPRLYDIVERPGGFSVTPGPDLGPEMCPFTVKIKAAYDVLDGDPLNSYSSFDFNFDDKDIDISQSGDVSPLAVGPNEIAVEITGPSFRVDVDGFDVHRDLFVDAVRQSQ